MRTGQRDVHNTPLKRRLSITYEELETLKKSIKVSVLNEVRAEMENSSDLDSIKGMVLSEIRAELMGIPNPSSLKASILNELRTELNSEKGSDAEATSRKLKEMVGIQDGLVRELLDQKTLIKKLEAEVQKFSSMLEDLKNTAPAAPPAVPLSLLEDPLDLPPLSKKPKHKPELRKEGPSPHELLGFREVPAPLPGTSAKVRLKIREVDPRELDEEEVETKCEYIIAESGDRKRFKGNIRQQTPVRTAPVRDSPARESPVRTAPVRDSPLRESPVRTAPVRVAPVREPSMRNRHDDPGRARPDEDYKCEYIIAEKAPKKDIIDESVDLREDEDAEIITCCRKNS